MKIPHVDEEKGLYALPVQGLFVLGFGGVDPKKLLEPRREILFRACRGPPQKKIKWNDSVQDWLKSHFWTLATFTDSLILSSNKVSIWNSF